MYGCDRWVARMLWGPRGTSLIRLCGVAPPGGLPHERPLPPNGNMAGRVRRGIELEVELVGGWFWRSIAHRDRQFLAWIAKGYRLEWDESKGPAPASYAKNHTSALNNPDFVDKQVRDMLKAGACKHSASRPKVVSPLGAVPKPTGDKLRLILDLRGVNSHLV